MPLIHLWKMENSDKLGIVELIDRTLNKGVILNADLIITVAEVPLLAANLKLALASVETMLKYGVMNDWLGATKLEKKEENGLISQEIPAKNEVHIGSKTKYQPPTPV